MSKKHGQPMANTPAPRIPEREAETTGAIQQPEAETTGAIQQPEARPTPIDLRNVPSPPPIIIGLAGVLLREHKIPKWVTYALAYTGSRYGATPPAVNNWTGHKAEGTEPKTAEGWAFFPNPPFSFKRAAVIVHRLTAGNYRDPEAVVDQLAERFPKLKDANINYFTAMEG